MSRTSRTVTVALLVAALVASSTTAATAELVANDRWSYSDSFEEEFCGVEVRIDVEAQGTVKIRQQRPGSPAYLFSNVAEFREVITNTETGAWFVIRGRENAREVTATQVDGDVYLFRQHFAGQRFVIEDSSGTVVYRDRGLLVAELVFDTLGDDQPGGEEISFEFVEMRGFPGYLEDICGIVHDLIG